jgi:hypothetical protein
MSDDSKMILGVVAEILNDLATGEEGVQIAESLAFYATKLLNAFERNGFTRDEAVRMTIALIAGVTKSS